MKNIYRMFCLLILLLFANKYSSAQTALQTLANNMQPGTFSKLSTIGFTKALLETPGSFITPYTDDATWDPVTKQLFFLGNGHASTADIDAGLATKFISYTDSTNTWNLLPDPPPGLYHLGHAYDHSTLGNGKFYHRRYGYKEVWRYDISSAIWDLMTLWPFNYYVAITGGLTFFPERNSLVYISGGSQNTANSWAIEYNLSTGVWSTLSLTLHYGEYQTFSEYNPVHHVLWFGGGEWYAVGFTNETYKMTASGAITKMNNAPCTLGINNSIISVDPVSGKYLVFDINKNFWTYDIIADVWELQSTASNPAPPFAINQPTPLTGTIATPISTYGVTMFAKYAGATGPEVWLYKGAASSPPPPDTTPPSAPSNLSVAAISSTTVKVQWIASTDNIEVIGYKIFRNNGQAGLAGALNFTDIGLTPSTSYIYDILAYDAAGNESLHSLPITVSTNSCVCQ